MKNRFTTSSDKRPATSDKSGNVLPCRRFAFHESAGLRPMPPSLVAGRLSLVAGRRGFTLVEMLIVVALIALLAMIAVPSFITMFSAGAESQDYNSVSALLNYARAHALKTNNYVAVHFQPAAGKNSLVKNDNCYAAILEFDPTLLAGAGAFRTPTNPTSFPPVAMPQGVGIGQLASPFVDVNNDKYDDDELRDDLDGFMTFTIVFSPQGTVVTKINGKLINFDGPNSYFDGSLWVVGTATQDKEGVRALTIFSRTKIEPLTAPGKRVEYLATNAPYLPVNSYTGQLFPR